MRKVQELNFHLLLQFCFCQGSFPLIFLLAIALFKSHDTIVLDTLSLSFFAKYKILVHDILQVYAVVIRNDLTYNARNIDLEIIKK